jgi:hypothetical protein
MHWHYSKRMPIGKLVKAGAWEDGQFIGCVLFARGNTPTLGDRYGLQMVEVCELVRVALCAHRSAVSRIVAIALRMLRCACPGLRLVVSFADPAQGHVGSIYQAGGWVYTGKSEPSWQWLHEGRWKHNREITSGAFGGDRKVTNYAMLPKRLPLGKHRYLYPLDQAMKEQIALLAKPYPKRAAGVDSDTAGHQPAEGGARPTAALHEE